MKSKVLCLIYGMLILLCLISCCTDPVIIEPVAPIFPPKPERVILVEDSNINEYRLMVQDIRWMMWASFAEWKSGIITEEVYQQDIERLQGVLDRYDEIFQVYRDQINLLD